MPKPDQAHQWTDEELKALERRISGVYKDARDSLQKTIDDYFNSFRERDQKMKKLIGTVRNGKEWTEQDYLQWRMNQIARGERFRALRDKIAERMTKANETAIAYVNDATPGIYSLNRNYAAYTIERVNGNVGFTLWDESTVRRILRDAPELMPNYPAERALKRGIDLAWGKKQISASVTSGILQGKSIRGIADDLQERITNMNRESAVRTARTAVTGAQNAGRMDSYEAAAGMGIKVRKRWVATKDGRTRHAHQKLDGQTVDWDEPFSSELGKIRFPGDPQAKPANVYNCRCTLRTVEKPGIEAEPRKMRVRDPKTGRNVVVEEMTYEQWERWKKDGQADIIKETVKPLQYKRFDTGESVNDFFYYDGEERGLMARKRSKYGQWEKSLTSEQKSAVDAYTTGGYSDLNDFLRKRGDWQNIDANAMTEFRDDLRAVIHDFELKEPIKVYRYTGKDTFGSDLNSIIGQEWSDAGFMSTSPTMQGIENAVVTGKDYLLEIDVPAGKGIGAYLNNLSPWKDTEYEFLLVDGTKFEITGVDTSGDKPIIRMVVKA